MNSCVLLRGGFSGKLNRGRMKKEFIFWGQPSLCPWEVKVLAVLRGVTSPLWCLLKLLEPVLYSDLSPESRKDRGSENLGVQGVGLAAGWFIQGTPGPDQP